MVVLGVYQGLWQWWGDPQAPSVWQGLWSADGALAAALEAKAKAEEAQAAVEPNKADAKSSAELSLQAAQTELTDLKNKIKIKKYPEKLEAPAAPKK